MFTTSRAHRGFTLVELVMTAVILAILTMLAFPVYSQVVNSAQSTSATVALANIAHNADIMASAHNNPLPTEINVVSAISSVPGFTGLASTLSAPAPSTSPHAVSYDASDSSTVTPPAVGMALKTENGGCIMALITASGVQTWSTTSTGLACDGANALGGTTGNPPSSTTLPSTTTTTTPSSTTTTTVPSGATAPSTPIDVVAVAGDGSATVTWAAPANGGSPITGYVVLYSANGGTTWTTATGCTSTALSCTITGLINGTTYEVKVAATNAIGNSPYSAPASVTPATTATAPTAPTNVVAAYTLSTTQATISWTAPSNDGYGHSGGTNINDYTVSGSPGGSCTSAATGAPSTSCLVTGLTPGSSYTFTVTAHNTASLTSSASTPSNSITVVTTPTAPTSVVATYVAGTTSAALSWAAPSNDGYSNSTGAHITSYTVTAAGDSSLTCVAAGTPAATSCSVSGLTPGISYTFTVTATNSRGLTSVSSTTSNATGVVATTPTSPTSPLVTYTPGSTSATISWDAPVSDGYGNTDATGITAYTVAGTPAGSCTSSASSAPDTSCTVTGLTPGTSYTFTVSATNASALTSVPSLSTSPFTVSSAPDAPTNVVVTYVPGDSTASLTWTAPDDPGVGPMGTDTITGYTATSSSDGLTCNPTGSPAATSCVISGLNSGTAYTFTVTATNSDGLTGPSSDPSNSTGVVALSPSVPLSPSAAYTPGSTAVVVSWGAPADDGFGNSDGAKIINYTVSDGVGGTCVSMAPSAPTTSCTVSGLTPGQTYTFNVTATNADVATSSPSASTSPATTVVITPTQPTSVIATYVLGSTAASVSWSPPSNDGYDTSTGTYITSYAVTGSPGGSCTTSGSPAATGCAVTGLSPGVPYTFTVTATNAASLTGPASAPSNTVAPLTVPDAPTSVSGTSYANTQSVVSWTAPSGNGAAVTSYTVQYSSNGGSTWSTATSSASSSPYTVTGLANGVPYIFRVSATNFVGAGPYSVPSASATPATVPNTPTSAAGTSAENTQSTVSWTPQYNGGATIASYVIQYSSDGGTTWTIATTSPVTCTASPCVITGLSNGTGYLARVAAVNAAGQGAYSSASAAFTPATIPGAPTGVAGASYANSQSVVTWTAPTDNGGHAITGYAVQYAVSPYTSWTSATSNTGSTATTYTVTSLTNGTPYKFEVAAITSIGTGNYSSPSAPATPATVPGAPTGVAGTNYFNGQSSVSWAAPGSSGGATITSYTVQYSVAPYTSWTTATTSASSSPYTVTGLTNGTAYEFRVSATNGAGTGSYSSASSPATPATAPGAPTGVAGTNYANAQSAVSWTAPGSAGGTAITGYLVQYSSDGGTTWTTATSSATTSPYLVNGLVNGTGYVFEVAAENASADSPGPWSSVSSSVTPATVPGAPTGASATPGNASASVSWSAPGLNGGAPITLYTVTSSPGSSPCTASISPCTVTGLTNGTSYTFSVTATNAAGTGAASTSSSPVTPTGPPTAPASVTPSVVAAGNMQVNWTAPTSNGGLTISAYTVQYAPSPYTSWTTATTAGSASTMTYLVTGLANGTSYEFRVAATNSYGTGPTTTSSALSTPALPATPSGTGTAPSTGAVQFNFANSSNGGASYQNWYFTGACSGGPTNDGGSNSSSIICSGLSSGTSYTEYAYTTNAYGLTSSTSAGETATTTVGVPTQPGTPIISVNTPTTYSAYWAASTDNGGPTITYYVYDEYGSQVCSTTSTSCSYTDVMQTTWGSTLYFYVIPQNSAGNGAQSANSATIYPSVTISTTVVGGGGSSGYEHFGTDYGTGGGGGGYSSCTLINQPSGTVLSYTVAASGYNRSGAGGGTSSSGSCSASGGAYGGSGNSGASASGYSAGTNNNTGTNEHFGGAGGCNGNGGNATSTSGGTAGAQCAVSVPGYGTIYVGGGGTGCKYGGSQCGSDPNGANLAGGGAYGNTSTGGQGGAVFIEVPVGSVGYSISATADYTSGGYFIWDATPGAMGGSGSITF